MLTNISDIHKKAESKLFNRLFLSVFLGILLFVSLVIGIIDPAFHYHEPIKGVSYVLNKERYQNNGIVRHFDYDALVTGTSMAENTNTTEVDDLFGVSSIKTCFMGASYRELGDNIRVALGSNPQLKLVIRAIDLADMISPSDSHISNDSDSEYDYPAYLYDANPFNDIEYLLNMKMLEYATNDMLLTFKGEPGTTFDEYSNWSDKYEYGAEAVLKSYNRPDKSNDVAFSDEDKALVDENLGRNVIDLALDYPNVEFYVWVPPYSICYYDVENQSGNLARQLDSLEYAMSLLTAIPNIKLFCYIDRYDIVTNLDLYKDRAHYSGDINSELLNSMYSEDGLITEDNYKNYMESVRTFYLSFDYDGLYRQ